MCFTKEKLYILLTVFSFCFVCCNKVDSQQDTIKTKNVILDESQTVVNTERVSEKKDLIRVQEFEFVPLAENEGLRLEVKRSKLVNDFDVFVVFTNTGRDIFRFEEKSFYHIDEYVKYLWYENERPKGLFFAYINFSNISYGLRDGFCFIDGKRGRGSLYLVSSADFFAIDDNASYICICDAGKVPILSIYDLETLQEIKKIVYEPYRDKGMYPIKMNYENGAFIVELSADTVDFTILEIPIDNTNDYRVVDSYSWEEDVAKKTN